MGVSSTALQLMVVPSPHNFSSPDNELNSGAFVLSQNINLTVFSLLVWGFMGRNAVVKN